MQHVHAGKTGADHDGVEHDSDSGRACSSGKGFGGHLSPALPPTLRLIPPLAEKSTIKMREAARQIRGARARQCKLLRSRYPNGGAMDQLVRQPIGTALRFSKT